LLDLPRAVGVLDGPAPVRWAFLGAPIDAVLAAVAEAPSLEELYVDARDAELIRRLTMRGWSTDARMEQMVRSTHVDQRVPQAPGGVAARLLGPADMPRVREALVAWTGAEPDIIAAGYPDDFFTVAAPVSLFAAYDRANEIVGVIGVRRQSQSSMVFALAVDPAYRQEHLGRYLVDRAVRNASADGTRFLHAQANPMSARLLTSTGFVPVGAWCRMVRSR
jgi:GNAT superfamily N-acetyltransferase